MKTATTAFKTSITAESSSLTRLLIIKTKTGRTYRLTDSDVDLFVAGNMYKATEGFSASAVSSEAGQGMQGMSVQFALSLAESAINRKRIYEASMDSAEVEVLAYNRLSPSAGTTILFKGRVDDIEFDNFNNVSFEIIGRVESGQSNLLLERYSPLCRADFGDARCKIDLDLHSHILPIRPRDDNISFYIAPEAIPEVEVPPKMITISVPSKVWACYQTLYSKTPMYSEVSTTLTVQHMFEIPGYLYNVPVYNYPAPTTEPDQFTKYVSALVSEGTSPVGNFQAPYYVNVQLQCAVGFKTETVLAPAPDGVTIPDIERRQGGFVLFLSGVNEGLVIEVNYYEPDTNLVVMQLRAPGKMEEGDLVKLVRGCDKTVTSCKRYNNILNFRGEPFPPAPLEEPTTEE